MDLRSSYDDNFVKIEKQVFRNVDFSSTRVTGFDFIQCTFENCDFAESMIWSCLFNESRFINTNLTTLKIFESEIVSTTIENCKCALLHFADCTFKASQFLNCWEILDAYFGNCIFEDTNFIKSNVTYCRFENNHFQETPRLGFKDCLLSRNYFTNLDLKEFRFIDSCLLNLNVFQNCKIYTDTFQNSVETTGQEYNSIDFSSINQSQKIPADILRKLFGILNSDIKDYVFGLTNEIKLQSVFISYSFKNKEFAKRLNSSLMAKGVITFLWEKDAPGGKGLKKIMKENVHKFDRVLFIASEYSLRSSACQFELSEGRKKQEKLWKDIYFPIHIDDYLFEVQKDDIRPLDKQDEYWDNIQELKSLNSIDFSSFVVGYNENEYEEKIYNLVRDLKQ